VRAGSLTCFALAVSVAVWVAPAQANQQQAGIQVALRALGVYSGPIDGDVGPATVAAVKAAQERRHLPVTGIADTRTRRALGPLGQPLFGDRVVRRSDFGLDVSVLQFILLRDGLYQGALDGYVGAETQAAVRRFQRRARLVPDGVVGPRTLAALVRLTGVPVRRRPASPTAPRPVYVVRPGDTLTAIADRFGLSLTRLAHTNGFDPATVLLIGKRLTIPTPALEATPAGIQGRLDTWSARLGVSPHLVRALAWMESGDQPRVVSSAGARGILQTLPSTRQYVEEVLVGHPLPHTVDGDIEVGVLYLRHLLQRFGGNEQLALAGWYEGEDAVRNQGIFAVTKPFVADVLALETRM
jgi:peptidoglycan hydrolase-like protein with peptidoglycan-binding domain